MGASKKSQVVGYNYYLGMHVVVCHSPIDAVTQVLHGDKVVFTGRVVPTANGLEVPLQIGDPAAVSRDDPNAPDPGLTGPTSIMFGADTQAKNSYLVSRIGADIPAYRGIVSMVLNGCYVTRGTYIDPVNLVVERTKTLLDWQPTLSKIITTVDGFNYVDMNPAHIIYECLTNTRWGMGFSPTDIDDASFVAAATTLKTEGLGMSMTWDAGKQINDFIKIVLQTISANLRISRDAATAGKFQLKLVRKDYDPTKILALDDYDVAEVSEFKRLAPTELVNQVTVKYNNQKTYNTDSVTVQDLGGIANASGAIISKSFDYPGVSNPMLASQLAYRELSASGYPLASCTIKMTRQAETLAVGDVFKLTYTPYGIKDVVLRAISVQLGSLTDGQVTVKAVQDVFSAPLASYAVPPSSQWSDPATYTPTAIPASLQLTVERPFAFMAQRYGQQAAEQLTDTTTGWYHFCAAPTTGFSLNAALFSKLASAPTFPPSSFTQQWTPYGKTSAAILPTDTTITLASVSNTRALVVGAYGFIEREIVEITAINGLVITVSRGILDGPPASHAAGTTIFFVLDALIDSQSGTDGDGYSKGDSVVVAVCPRSASTTLPVVSATPITTAMVGRHAKPAPPGNVKINGAYFPAAITGNAAITFASRNKKTDTVQPHVLFTAADVTNPDTITYIAKVSTQAAPTTVTYTSPASSTTSITIPSANIPSGGVIMRVYSVLAGVESLPVEVFANKT